MESLKPRDAADLADLIASAIARDQPLELIGRGSKRGFGRPVGNLPILDLSALSGLRFYEPDELVMRAGSGMLVSKIEAMLTQSRQMLAFEPPDYGPLFGEAADAGTLGGLIACNLAGPRRMVTRQPSPIATDDRDRVTTKYRQSIASPSVHTLGRPRSTASALVLPLGRTTIFGQRPPNSCWPQVSTSRTVPSPPSTTR